MKSSDYLLKRPEIYIQDVNTEFSPEFKKTELSKIYSEIDKNHSTDLISAQIFRSQYDHHSYLEAGSASTLPQPNSGISPLLMNQSLKYEDKSASPYLERAKYTNDYNNYEFSTTSNLKPIQEVHERVLTTYSEKTPHFTGGIGAVDLSNYTSVVSESTPVKEINAITAKASVLSDKQEPAVFHNERELYNSRLSVSRHSAYNTNNNQDISPSTPSNHPNSVHRGGHVVRTPNNRPSHIETDVSGKKSEVYRSPVPSNRSSVVPGDHNNVTPDRKNGSEFYASRHSHVSSHSKVQAQQAPQRPTARSNMHSLNSSPELKKSQIQHNEQPREPVPYKKGLFGWNLGFCGQNTMIEEPEADLGENIHTTQQKEETFRSNRGPQTPMRKVENEQTHDYIRIDNQKHGHHQSMVFSRNGDVYNKGTSTRSAQKSNVAERNSTDIQDHIFSELGGSPLKFRREPVTQGLGRSAVHEGRLGSVRWRLELEHVDDESERYHSRRSVEAQDDWIPVRELTHEEKRRENHKRSSRPLSMMSGSMPTPVQQVYHDNEGNQIYRLSEKAKHNFIVDSRMDSLLKTSEAAAQKDEYLERMIHKAMSDTKPKKHSNNFSISSYGDNFVSENLYKRGGMDHYNKSYAN